MKKPSLEHLSRRERQIMDVLHRQGSATAAEIHEQIPEPPSYSAVRAALRVLETKGHVQHRRSGHRYVFSPTLPRGVAQENAARRLLETFFAGSATHAVAALLDASERITAEEAAELRELIDAARGQER